MKYKPVVLVIFDGFGVAAPSEGNVVSLAKMPYFEWLIQNYPHTTLQSSGEEVGLPWREMGNSEVGHMNLGSGRVIYQELPRINKAITDKSFFENRAFLDAINHVKKNKSKLHLMGLTSSTGVHAHIDHLLALLKLAKQNGLKEVFVHAFLDGRDAPKDSGKDYIKQLLNKTRWPGIGKLATMSGRFYAMDRDNNWERIKKAYDAMTLGIGEKCEDPMKCILNAYNKKIYDEEFLPTVIMSGGKPVAKVENNDAIIFFNYRTDRAKEITKAFIGDKFDGFKREKIENLFFAAMTKYESGLNMAIAFEPREVKNTLAETLSKNKIKQYHTAETEKYAHVTFFFNNNVEKPFWGEVHEVVPSPKVPSYDQKPEMSAPEVCEKVLKAIDSDFGFILVNFANPDMVGHTGNIEATKKALEFLDGCLQKIGDKLLKNNGLLMLVSDHGNCEEKINLQSGRAEKEHTANPVPFIIAGRGLERKSDDKDLSAISPIGVLADVAPTILGFLGVEKPEEMTGTDLSKLM